jgi:hypothetical protein
MIIKTRCTCGESFDILNLKGTRQSGDLICFDCTQCQSTLSFPLELIRDLALNNFWAEKFSQCNLEIEITAEAS